ncbi:MAG: RNA polymerase subunit sigma-70 [Methylobacter sp.]|nr:MAG: RNA polymerase subunit sigma-70 [Methylobacter sp.]
MPQPTQPQQPDTLEATVRRAQQGERAALEAVVRAIQPDVHKLALRFLCCPHDAEDASQEILIRVITGLSSFRGDSRFRTWVYRVASNVLLSLRPQRLEQQAWDFTGFAADLADGLIDGEDTLHDSLLLEEVKIGCTLAMLQCLDRGHRLAYIVGEIMELDHSQAAAVLDIAPAAFRKRLSRARADIITFMQGYCGLVNPDNACRCHKRVSTAITLGRVDAAHLQFASSPQQARQFPQVLVHIRQLEAARRAAALYQSHPEPRQANDIGQWLRQLLEEGIQAY